MPLRSLRWIRPSAGASWARADGATAAVAVAAAVLFMNARRVISYGVGMVLPLKLGCPGPVTSHPSRLGVHVGEARRQIRGTVNAEGPKIEVNSTSGSRAVLRWGLLSGFASPQECYIPGRAGPDRRTSPSFPYPVFRPRAGVMWSATYSLRGQELRVVEG